MIRRYSGSLLINFRRCDADKSHLNWLSLVIIIIFLVDSVPLLVQSHPYS